MREAPCLPLMRAPQGGLSCPFGTIHLQVTSALSRRRRERFIKTTPQPRLCRAGSPDKGSQESGAFCVMGAHRKKTDEQSLVRFQNGLYRASLTPSPPQRTAGRQRTRLPTPRKAPFAIDARHAPHRSPPRRCRRDVPRRQATDNTQASPIRLRDNPRPIYRACHSTRHTLAVSRRVPQARVSPPRQ